MKVSKWGNSLAIRIPRDVVEALSLREGDEVQLVAGAAGLLKLDRRIRREEAVEGLSVYAGRLPSNYRFDRDEANAR